MDSISVFHFILVCTCFWPQTDRVYVPDRFVAAAQQQQKKTPRTSLVSCDDAAAGNTAKKIGSCDDVCDALTC